MNFRTAFYNHKGMLITDTRAIAEHYLTGWFAIDFLSCLPVGYINYVSDDPATGAALPSFTHCFSHVLDLLSAFAAPISGAGDDSWQRWVLPLLAHPLPSRLRSGDADGRWGAGVPDNGVLKSLRLLRLGKMMRYLRNP